MGPMSTQDDLLGSQLRPAASQRQRQLLRLSTGRRYAQGATATGEKIAALVNGLDLAVDFFPRTDRGATLSGYESGDAAGNLPLRLSRR